jgi:hypothetical protein
MVSAVCRVAVAWTLNAAALLVSGVHYHHKKGMKDETGVLTAIGTWQATSGFMILRALSFFMDLHWAILQRTPGDSLGNLGVPRPLPDSSTVCGMAFEQENTWGWVKVLQHDVFLALGNPSVPLSVHDKMYGLLSSVRWLPDTSVHTLDRCSVPSCLCMILVSITCVGCILWYKGRASDGAAGEGA